MKCDSPPNSIQICNHVTDINVSPSQHVSKLARMAHDETSDSSEMNVEFATSPTLLLSSPLLILLVKPRLLHAAFQAIIVLSATNLSSFSASDQYRFQPVIKKSLAEKRQFSTRFSFSNLVPKASSQWGICISMIFLTDF